MDGRYRVSGKYTNLSTEASFQGLIDIMNRNSQIIVQQHKALEERVSNIWEWDCNDNDAIANQFIGQISLQQYHDIQHLIQRQKINFENYFEF